MDALVTGLFVGFFIGVSSGWWVTWNHMRRHAKDAQEFWDLACENARNSLDRGRELHACRQELLARLKQLNSLRSEGGEAVNRVVKSMGVVVNTNATILQDVRFLLDLLSEPESDTQ